MISLRSRSKPRKGEKLMNVYLVQHGKPVSKEENPDRPLSGQGREDVEKMGDFLNKAGIMAELVFHSGKTRARETAEILASKISLNRRPLEKKGLSPMDDPKGIAEELERMQEDVIVVGHLPHLAKLTSLLTVGRDSHSVVALQQGGAVCLKRLEAQEGWTIAWMVVPTLIYNFNSDPV